MAPKINAGRNAAPAPNGAPISDVRPPKAGARPAPGAAPYAGGPSAVGSRRGGGAPRPANAPAPIPIFYHHDFAKFDFGEFHPFRGHRFHTFMETFKEFGLATSGRFELRDPHEATDAELATVHSPEYVQMVEQMEREGGYLSSDTRVMPGMVRASRLMFGSALDAARLAVGEAHPLIMTFGGFHHAGKESGEGFCLFNDVAGAARYATAHGMERVMVIDTDAHQGNGTMDLFWEEKQVLFLSIHQDPSTLYPGRGFAGEIGHGEGKGYTVNIPLPPRSGIEEYRLAFDRIIDPVAAQFRPQLIIRNGGSDPFWGDELTRLGLDMAGLTEVAARVRRISSSAGCPQIDMTASGYGDHVIDGWFALLRGSAGLDLSIPEPAKPGHPWLAGERTMDGARAVMDELAAKLAFRWKL